MICSGSGDWIKKHGLTNVAVLIFFGTALYYRLSSTAASPLVFIGLEIGVEFYSFLQDGWAVYWYRYTVCRSRQMD
ncbi:MAG: hypothetical protein JWP81_5182 [Ferruginibacter sp.]|nr:hypothetical protein [Ferruginibacter sp.]